MELKKQLFYMQRRHLFMDLKLFIRNTTYLSCLGFSSEDEKKIQARGETCKLFLKEIRKMKIKK